MVARHSTWYVSTGRMSAKMHGTGTKLAIPECLVCLVSPCLGLCWFGERGTALKDINEGETLLMNWRGGTPSGWMALQALTAQVGISRALHRPYPIEFQCIWRNLHPFLSMGIFHTGTMEISGGSPLPKNYNSRCFQTKSMDCLFWWWFGAGWPFKGWFGDGFGTDLLMITQVGK